MDTLQVEVTRVSIEERTALTNLLELYSYDVSELTGWDLDEPGLFKYRYLEHYWTESDRIPFLICVDSKLAGFVLVRIRPCDDGGTETSIAEFFVMRK